MLRLDGVCQYRINWLQAYAVVWNYVLKIHTGYACRERRLLWIWIAPLARPSTCVAASRIYRSCEWLFASRFICIVVNTRRGKDILIPVGSRRTGQLQSLSISLLLFSAWSTFVFTSSGTICKTVWHVLPKETSANRIPKYNYDYAFGEWSNYVDAIFIWRHKQQRRSHSWLFLEFSIHLTRHISETTASEWP